jgi:hypothetical protein
MVDVRLSDEEIAQRGKDLYQRQIRNRVETEKNVGKLVAIDVKSGDYEIDADLLTAAHRVRDRHPDAELWMERIGYGAVYAFSSSLPRTPR